ncbi:hypothetical protein S-MbCM7_069 [Synechococcus phage ACG-2014h]|uniref:Uncharacterized protein n=1 Tax=Synechococcus phage ACG-2014h TaxID=1340810 RepID=V5US65_9CAUD|nr:hypothetical protein S-MbCM7_069 [Synechococcus phage ACG-2014h]AHB80483.1 hypothetical protein S-MbCM7_069 [Synechococcus phage ACG-2014h]
MENPFGNYDSILENFDAFCDGFEKQAAERFLRGGKDGSVLGKYASQGGGDTPSAVREISEPGGESPTAGESTIDVQASHSDGEGESSTDA